MQLGIMPEYAVVDLAISLHRELEIAQATDVHCNPKTVMPHMPPACRIVDVPDDLSWALFAYSGAAAAAGQAYTGAVLCTADGQWPAASHEERVNAALRSACPHYFLLCTMLASMQAGFPPIAS